MIQVTLLRKGLQDDQETICLYDSKNKPVCVFNLAAETHVDRSIDEPESFIKSNILGVFNLLESFSQTRKKKS